MQQHRTSLAVRMACEDGTVLYCIIFWYTSAIWGLFFFGINLTAFRSNVASDWNAVFITRFYGAWL